MRQPKSAGNSTVWPKLETGKSSLTPCKTASSIACRNVTARSSGRRVDYCGLNSARKMYEPGIFAQFSISGLNVLARAAVNAD